MLSSRPTLVFLLVALPVAAAAEELRFGVGATQQWESNALNTTANETDEFFLRITPSVAAKDDRGDLTWKVRYRPSYDVYYVQPDLNGWNHLTWIDATWRISPQTNLTLREHFASTQSATSFNETVVDSDGTETTDIVLGRRRTNRNTLGLTLAHRLGPRQVVSFGVEHGFRDGAQNLEVQTFEATTNYSVSLTERDQFGVGFTFTRQHFNATDFRESRDTDFYNAFGFFQHRFDPTLTLSVSAGPALVDGGQSSDPPSTFNGVQAFPLLNSQFVNTFSCPEENGDRILDTSLANSQCAGIGAPLDSLQTQLVQQTLLNGVPLLSTGSVSNTTVTFFANASLNKRWESWAASLGYRRRATTSSAITSEISDTFRSSIRWQTTQRLNISLNGVFTRRTQASDSRVTVAVLGESPLAGTTQDPAPGIIDPFMIPLGAAEVIGFRTVTLENDVELFQYIGQLTFNYQLRERLSTFARFYYSKQQPNGDVQFTRDVEDFVAAVGFSYEFEPIHF